jgi:hypothetical protein
METRSPIALEEAHRQSEINRRLAIDRRSEANRRPELDAFWGAR